MPAFWLKYRKFPDGIVHGCLYTGKNAAAVVDRVLMSLPTKTQVRILDVVPVNEHPTCIDCKHRVTCFASLWNERGGDEYAEHAETVSSVHTCVVCGEKVLTLLDASVERRIVPDACPRWDVIHGSATDCNACGDERLQFDMSLPRHVENRAAFVDLFSSLRAMVEGFWNNDLSGVPDSCIIAAKKDRYVRTMLPHPDLNRDHSLSSRILSVLMADLFSHADFRSAWDEYTPDKQAIVKYEWLEIIEWALERHQDNQPAHIIRAFALNITNRPQFCTTWAAIDPDVRAVIQERWASRVSAVLGTLPVG